MTLPDGVLYKSQTARPKNAATFAQSGQDLTWSGVNLGKKGASASFRLKVNVTNCADGHLAFAPTVTNCPTAASVDAAKSAKNAAATATVKHGKGWVACAPVERCDIPLGDGVFACKPRTCPCGLSSTSPFANDAAECFALCSAGGSDWGWWLDMGICLCYRTGDIVGYETDQSADCASLGQPRTLPTGDCPFRRLQETWSGDN
jgi:hypothetical protein